MKSIEIKCEFCHNQFFKQISEYKRCLKQNLKHFCSLSCSAKFSGLLKKQKSESTIQEYYKNPKKCKTCNSAIDYFAKNANEFCGSSCSATFNNPNRAVKKSCFCCGLTTKNKKFCNMKCFFIHKKKQTALSIEDGSKVTNDTFKSYLINKNGLIFSVENGIEYLNVTDEKPQIGNGSELREKLKKLLTDNS